MNKIIIIVMLVFLFGCASTSPTKDNLGYQGRNSEGPTVSELLAQFRSNPDVQLRKERGWEVAEVKSERALYSFTPENHPAYPSYVKREVIEKDGSIYIETSSRCGAEKDVCDQLIKDFIELNNKIKDNIGTK